MEPSAPSEYEAQGTAAFYDAYGELEWRRLGDNGCARRSDIARWAARGEHSILVTTRYQLGLVG